MLWIISIFLFFFLPEISNGKKGFGPGEQEWNFVEVRPGALMFWWLYYVTPPNGQKINVYEKPLLIWLQGGPGASSTGYGNFEEFGPLTLEGTPRNSTWVNDYNVLLIDNPVGTGFSYVTDFPGYAKTNKQIAEDLLECMRSFLYQLPDFEKVPTYIAGESYGGKMAAEFGLVLLKAQKSGEIKCNLKGVALGDSWISPMDSVLSWAPYLLSMGMIDRKGYQAIEKSAFATQKAVDMREWSKAAELWEFTENVIDEVTGSVDFYNILEKKSPQNSKETFLHGDEPIDRDNLLDMLMNSHVRKTLGINNIWGIQSSRVFEVLSGDFMKPVVHIVKQLIDEMDLEVFVYTGHLDLIVATPGTLAWVERMFSQSYEWQNATRRLLVVDNVIEGYVKEHKNFKMYWISRAGHMVPRDNPSAIGAMLKHLTNSG